LCNETVPGLAANQHAAHGSVITDAAAGGTALELGARSIRQGRERALSRVDDRHTETACGLQQCVAGRYYTCQLGNVVAQGFAEASRLEEIALHVDHEDRSAIQVDRKRTG